MYVSTYSVSNGSGNRCTVKFIDSLTGNVILRNTVTKYDTVSEPDEPTKDGYTFGGWYTDSKLVKEYDFESEVTDNLALYAKWVSDKKLTSDESTSGKDDNKGTSSDSWINPFIDVKKNDWFFDSVKYVHRNGLMNGTTANTFEPDGLVTRAMLVTVLWRAEGEPAADLAMPFTDVKDDYYTEAVRWAASVGIVKGITETEFAPDMSITREQIATIMHRYAVYKGTAPTGAWAIRLTYADLADISDYAAEGVMYCTLKGIMQGRDNNMFVPQDDATRAEIAAILERYMENNR